MILDFSKCKTVEDVNEIYNKNLKETKSFADRLELIKECFYTIRRIKSKLINKENH